MTLKEIRLKILLKKAHKAMNAYAMDSSLINWQRQLRATKLYNIAHTFNNIKYDKKKRKNAHDEYSCANQRISIS